MAVRILHIWNPAGVASILAKYMDRLHGTQSWVMTRKRYDPFGLTTYGERINSRARVFELRALWAARRYHILHIHSYDEIVPLLRLLYPTKLIVMHYHGSEIRDKWGMRKRFWGKADALLVATSNLLKGAPKGTLYLPRPIDMDLFYPKGKPEPDSAFHISYCADEDARDLARRHGLKLTVYDRDQKPIPYKEFADVLRHYEYYIDVKREGDYKETVISKTALEALACGCKVLQQDGVIDRFPPEHDPNAVVDELWKFYAGLLKKQ